MNGLFDYFTLILLLSNHSFFQIRINDNIFKMKSKIDVAVYYDLEGFIDKKSTHFILGFQPKFWKILDHGTKIGYRNIHQTEFLPQKVFNLTDVKTEELESLQEFQLHTPERVYELRTKSQQQCKRWMRAINLLKKDIQRRNKKNSSRKNKKSKPKKHHNEDLEKNGIESPQFSHIQAKTERRQKQLHQLSPFSPSNQSRINQSKDQYRQTRSNSLYKKGLNDTTLPSVNQAYSFEKQTADFRQSTASILNRNGSSLVITNLSRESIEPSVMSNFDEELKQKFNDFLKKIGPDYVNFHVFIMKLKTKSKELLTMSINSHYYLFFSSKSLYPQQHINEQNLTSSLLPYWADINTFYRLTNDKKSHKFFELSKVEQVQTSKSDYSIKIKSENETFQFFVDSSEEQKNFKFIIEMGRVNALETERHQLCVKKNYDLLVLLHTTNLIEFGQNIKEMVRKLMPTDHNYELNIFSKFVSSLNPQIFEITTVLEHKVNQQSIRNTLVDFVKIIHEELKIFLKLVWDSSFDKAKGVDISNILKSISTYHNLVNKYVVKDIQIYEAEKQLSKIYMRFSYKNFEKIIINIVDKQKNAKYYTVQNEDEEPFTQTHAITDMFQFIYDVFALAFPCWNDKLHLHNIHKLIYKAISIFIKQLKAMIDEEDLQTTLLIATANNYVTFTEQIDEFYENKLSQLKQGTKECYDELKTQFRQTSMVVIDKLVLPLKIQLKIFFDKQKFYNASMEQTYRLIIKSEIYQNMSNIHFILKRRYYERIFSTIRQEICKMLDKEVQSFKKKKQLKKVVEKLNTYKTDCLQMAQLLCKSKLKLEKQLSELIMLLTTQKKEQIAFLLTQANEFYKKVYKKVLTLREDYSSTIQSYLRNIQIQSPLKSPQKYHNNNQLQPRKSFSKEYMMEYDRNSIQFSSVQRVVQPSSSEEKIRMISDGFVYRNKSNNGAYEKIFFKLKKSVLYIYQNQKMERCQNTVQIEDIEGIKVANQEKPYFAICFMALHRSKQLKIKCESVQQSRRWIYTIQLQLKRLKNDKKMKVIKTKELKSNLIIDYQELTNGRDYFSYND